MHVQELQLAVAGEREPDDLAVELGHESCLGRGEPRLPLGGSRRELLDRPDMSPRGTPRRDEHGRDRLEVIRCRRS
jgi:hypothetical protein